MKGVINLRGNEYHTVAKRVGDMRDLYPASQGWGILTEIVTISDDVIICKASVSDPAGKIVATGFAEERRSRKGVNSTSALENCETSAVGRALAAMGFVGSGQYASADEMQGTTARVKNNKVERSSMIRDLAGEIGVSVTELNAFVSSKGWAALSGWPDSSFDAFSADCRSGKIKVSK